MKMARVKGEDNGQQIDQMAIVIVGLSQNLWSQLDESRKQKLVQEKKIVWIKYTVNGEAVMDFSGKCVEKIDVHARCFEEMFTKVFKLKEIEIKPGLINSLRLRVLLTNRFEIDENAPTFQKQFAENTPIIEIDDKTYEKRIQTYMPLLSAPRNDYIGQLPAGDSFVFMPTSSIEEAKED